jgi:lantibiotic modifying enzyme
MLRGSEVAQFLLPALSVARWLGNEALRTAGRSVNRELTESAESCDLYYGKAGILLVLLEAFHLTGDARHLEAAKACAEFLDRHLDLVPKFGLYDGLAGIAFALAQLGRSVPDHRELADRVSSRLRAGARRSHSGLEWNDSFDIVSGTAGIGLALLDLSRESQRSDLLELAVRAGDQLMDTKVQIANGCHWPPARENQKQYSNFAHGTAGIGYFLARLFGATGQLKYLQAARDAANYLQTIMSREGNYRGLISHDNLEGRDLFYLGWCHGPAGTSRLFFQLYREIQEERWWQPIHQSAATVMVSGIPEQINPGCWNNTGLCCGAAGIADWMLALFAQTAREEYRSFSQRIARHLLERASPDQNGLSWVQAENRKEPQNLAAQVGLMQGSAGIALFLIHLEESFRKIEPLFRLPDSPW